MQSSLWSRYGTKRRWPSWRRGVGNEPINSADDGFRLISHVSRGLRGLWLGLPPAAKPAGDAAAANPHRADTYGLHGSDLGCRSGGKQAGKPLLPIRT